MSKTTQLRGSIARKWLDAEGFDARTNLEVEHVFAEGVYTRIMSIPAGLFVVGEVHKHETTNIMLNGQLMIYSGADSEPMTVYAGEVFVSPPGCRKIVLSCKDTRIANIHPTPLKDLAQIEKQFIVSEDEAPDFSTGLENFIFQLAEGVKTDGLGQRSSSSGITSRVEESVGQVEKTTR